MTINYIEKGHFLHDEIKRQGFSLFQKDDVWIADNDAAVQNIINTFDPLPEAKKEKRKELKTEAMNRAVSVYEFIEDIEPVSFFQFAEDLFTSILPAARDTLKPNLLALKDIRDTANDAIDAINALATLNTVLSYDVINDPTWP